MFFILSKLLSVFLSPVCWIVLLLVWRWLTKSLRTKKRLVIIVFLIALLFTNPFIYRSLVKAWQSPPHQLATATTFEAGILLGGLSYYDQYNQGFFSDASDRFIQAANLYHRGIIKKILVSGGTGNLLQREPPETDFLKEQFIANGIKETDIITESRSRNTYENAVFSKQILDSLHLKPPFVLITSAMHMPRAGVVFKKAGVDFIAYPCDYKVIESRFDFNDYITPDVTLFKKWSWFIKEIVGLYAYRVTGKA
jgi:uncharacterized SAM-binding protein YcdF (DUF218 family)